MKMRTLSFLLVAVLLGVIALFAPERFLGNSSEVPEKVPLASQTLEMPDPPQKTPLVRLVVEPRSEADLLGEEDAQKVAKQPWSAGAYPDSTPKETSETAPNVSNESALVVPSAPETSDGGQNLLSFPAPMALSDPKRPTTYSVSTNTGGPQMGRSVYRKRTHIIVNGDTLETIANRYLRDPNRAQDIYESNRDVLSSPDALTIGTKVTIPE